MELAQARQGLPIAGKDFKTGQTLMKTILAPGFKARMLGLDGWYSTNILGNRDGEVLDDPESFKIEGGLASSACSSTSCSRTSTPTSTARSRHVVRINYYPPRGDNKEGWDNIDIFGWLGYPMQIKVDFLCRDSILAAPIVLDLALFMDLAQRAGMSGIQEWLSFYFKSPMTRAGPVPRARSVHPAHEAEEHAAPPARRRADHPPRHRVLRLARSREPLARRCDCDGSPEAAASAGALLPARAAEPLVGRSARRGSSARCGATVGRRACTSAAFRRATGRLMETLMMA